MNATGTIQYATFASASGTVNGAAVDSQGNVWFVGSSAFAAQVDATGAHRFFVKLPFGASIGSSDQANRVTVDSQDAAYIAGYKQEITDEQITQTGYVATFDQSGQPLFTSYLGEGLDPSGVAVDTAGLIYMSFLGPRASGSAGTCDGAIMPSLLPFTTLTLLA